MRGVTHILAALAAATALGACAGGTMQGIGGFGSAGGVAPKSFVVSDFVVTSEIIAVDRGYTARLERKVGTFPPHERKQRTAERVNDEIVATIIATMREAGLDAMPGTEEALTFDQTVGVITGRLHPADGAKPATVGFGEGRGGVRATMAVSLFSSGGKRELTSFTIEPGSLARNTASAKTAAARNNAIIAALNATGAKERLSSDVEAQARRIGRGAGERIVQFAQEQGWLTAPEKQEVEAPARPARAQPVRAQPKPKSKPKQEDQPEQEPEAPADTNDQQPASPWPRS